MNVTNIIRGVVNATKYTVTAPIIKEDYGLYLKIEGLDLPTVYEVDFSNSENNGSSVTMIGNADGVLIPRQFIKSGQDVFAFLYWTGEDFGRTVYKFKIPNKLRPDRTDEQPTPEEQSLIDQAISALNSAVEQTAEDVETATAKAAEATSAAATATQKASEATESAQAAGTYATRAETAQNAAESARDMATAKATAAATSAESAAGSAVDALDAAEDAEINAGSAAQSALDARDYKDAANLSAESASEYAGAASDSATTATEQALIATNKASESAQSALDASTAKDNAVTAKTAAETAQTAAETAQAAAEEAARTLTIDNTLTYTGQAADAKATGDKISGLREDLSDITGNTIVGFTSGKYIATSGDTANINTLVTNATYAYAVLDCAEGDVFTITGHGGSTPRLFAFLGADADGVRPVLSKATQSADLTNQYITAPENAEKLVVNVNRSFAHCLITGKSIVNVWDNVGNNTADIAKLGRVILYPNLTNPDDYTAGYKTNTGQTNTTSPTYMFTAKIPVNYGETVYFTTSCRYVCAFNANGTVVSESGVDAYNIMSYVVPQGIASIQATFRATDESEFMATVVEGQEYIPYGTPVIDSQYVPHYDTDNSYIALKTKDNYYRVSSDSMAVDDYLIINKKMPVKNDTVLQFSGNITGEFAGIEFGFTDDISQSDSTHFKLDSTKLYRVTSSPLETDHNLTISGNLSITVTQTYTHLMVDITCNGQKFHNSSGWAPQNKYLYVKVLSSMTDCVLSWTACKSKKNVVIFGDSYVSYSASRWVYYLEENSFDDNVVISGYSGEGSENGYQNFTDLMPVLSTQYVVWAYGMNDHDTSSAANATWKQKLDAVIAYCEQNGLTPVLCTIPNVPSYSNAYKNAYVRSFIGTYPVIDFAKAVGSDISSSWFAGMLSSDNVHPTEAGAMALYNRAIADFPQLCVS